MLLLLTNEDCGRVGRECLGIRAELPLDGRLRGLFAALKDSQSECPCLDANDRVRCSERENQSERLVSQARLSELILTGPG